MNNNEGERAELLSRLIGIDGGNFYYWWMLGETRLKIQPPDIAGATKALEMALHFRPNDHNLKRQLQVLRTYNEKNG
jgi:cytochrome c-type biogenesis protein CcmH/NrfG